MAPPHESPPPCHLLRMPHEILKPVFALVSASHVFNDFYELIKCLLLPKRDQISASKTCVLIWELAYPLAYNRVTVNISPSRQESEWKNLASGVGLRYVQHLEIRSLYGKDDKLKRIEDPVARTLIAAVPRDQLLSFRYGPCKLFVGDLTSY